MTNSEKLQRLYLRTGPELFEDILQDCGPGNLYFPQNAYKARRKARNLQIKADYYTKLSKLPPKEAIKQLAKEYDLSPDRIRKIINASGSG